jgi:hypothetical protein
MKITSQVRLFALAMPILAAGFWLTKSANIASFTNRLYDTPTGEPKACCVKPAEPAEPKHCVFKTLMGEESSDSGFVFKTPEKSIKALQTGLDWLVTAQNNDGGWSSEMSAYGGSRSEKKSRSGGKSSPEPVYKTDNAYNQDASAAASDPASTAMTCMALMRCGHNWTNGAYKTQFEQGINFLLQATEQYAQHPTTITDLTNTQPQRKLGANIDVVLTAQCLSNALHYLPNADKRTDRLKKSLDICVKKVQAAQNDDGSFKGNGWAGVLQSSFANNALEAAQQQGAEVDKKVLDRSRDYQKSNYDTRTGDAKTDMGAGVVLYSVSSSGRGSAVEARAAKDEIKKAKKAGKLKEDAEINAENLRTAGVDEAKALKYATAYEVNTQANAKAQSADVMTGFGNNGGEEFLSFLQTGEGMIVAQDDKWEKWYDNVSGTIIKIQNQDGSWNGHHCITSPVFCTATCLLVLSVPNEVGLLQK